MRFPITFGTGTLNPGPHHHKTPNGPRARLRHGGRQAASASTTAHAEVGQARATPAGPAPREGSGSEPQWYRIRR